MIIAGDDSASNTALAQMVRAQAATKTIAPTCADDACFWLYSSGSTGTPKGTVHLHSHLIQTAELYGRGVLGIQESDVVYSAAKLFFAYGLGNGLTFPMSVGATAVLLPGAPDPGRCVRHPEETPADHLLRRAHAVRRPAGRPGAAAASRTEPARLHQRRRGPARRDRQASGPPSTAATSSTASARPRCCTSS